MTLVIIESPFGRNVDGSKCTPDEYRRNTIYVRRCVIDSLMARRLSQGMLFAI